MKDLQAYVASFDALTDGQNTDAILEQALAIVADYNRWCQGAQALDANCRRVKINSPHAVAWSIEGAVGRVSNHFGIIPPFILKYLDQMVLELVYKGETVDEFMDHHTVGWLNDRSTHDGVIEFMNEALRRCRD